MECSSQEANVTLKVILFSLLFLAVGTNAQATYRCIKSFEIKKHVFFLLFMDLLGSLFVIAVISSTSAMFWAGHCPACSWLKEFVQNMLVTGPVFTMFISFLRYYMTRMGAKNKPITNKKALGIVALGWTIAQAYYYLAAWLENKYHDDGMLGMVCNQTRTLPKSTYLLNMMLWMLPSVLMNFLTTLFDVLMYRFISTTVVTTGGGDVPGIVVSSSDGDDPKIVPLRATVMSTMLNFLTFVAMIIWSPEITTLSTLDKHNIVLIITTGIVATKAPLATHFTFVSDTERLERKRQKVTAAPKYNKNALNFHEIELAAESTC